MDKIKKKVLKKTINRFKGKRWLRKKAGVPSNCEGYSANILIGNSVQILLNDNNMHMSVLLYSVAITVISNI